MNKELKAIIRLVYNLVERLLGCLYPHIYPYIPKKYWDWQQRQFFRTWGCGARARKDDHIYRAYLENFPVKRLLDIGCGYGRLFPLYAELNIPEVIGIDISPYAISVARDKYPTYRTEVLKVEDLNFPPPPDYFDTAISNYTLAYVPSAYISQAIHNIVEQCKSVFLIEPVRRGEGINYARFLHNYESLFKDKMQLVQQWEYSSQHDVMIYSR